MKSQNKVRGLFLILAVALAMAVAGTAIAIPPQFEATIEFDPDPATVCVGETVTIAVEWTASTDVTRYEWSVDGVGQGENEIINEEEKQNGTRSFDFDATGLDTGDHTLCFHIWHHQQTERNAEDCVTITVENCGCECEATETAFAYDELLGTCFLDIEGLNANRWGWTIGPLEEGEYEFEIWAGAGQCDLLSGSLVGVLSVEYTGGTAIVTYNMDTCRTLKETHLYIGNDILPKDQNDDFTVAPGLYGNTHSEVEDEADQFVIDGLSGQIYLIAHAIVCVEAEPVPVPVGE
jgi:hypothetical protein